MNIDAKEISRKHPNLNVQEQKTGIKKVMVGLASAAVAVVVGAGVMLGMQANQTDQAQAATQVASQVSQANVAAHSTKTLHAANAVQGNRNNNFISNTYIDSVLLKENSQGAIQGIVKVDFHVDEQALQKYFHKQALAGDHSFSVGGLNIGLSRSEASVNQYVQKHMDAVHATMDNLKNGVKVNVSAENAVLSDVMPLLIGEAYFKGHANMNQAIESGHKAGYTVHLANDNMYAENLAPEMQGQTRSAIVNAGIDHKDDLAMNMGS